MVFGTQKPGPEELNSEPDYGLFDLDASGIIGRYNSSFDFLVVGIRQFIERNLRVLEHRCSVATKWRIIRQP